VNFFVTVYQRKVGPQLVWTTLGWGKAVETVRGHQPLKLQRTLSTQLRKVIAALPVARLEDVQSMRGVRLERVRLELSLRGNRRKQLSGQFPVILDPRWTTDEHRMTIAYHPYRQHEWCPVREDEPLEPQLALYFERVWAELDDQDLDELLTQGKDLLKTFAFDATPPSVLDLLPTKKRGVWDDLIIEPTKDGKAKKKEPRGQVALPKLATNQTLRALDGSLHLGLPRAPYREQLQRLLGPREKRSTLVVGPPGSGKSTLLARWVRDLADADDYPLHQNLDRIHDVWLLSGKRIIAGMSHLGEWEQRCLEVVEDAKQKRTVLWIEDIHAFGRLGQSKTSERSLADFFRGPIRRGELTLVAECTPEQLRRLEDDAPSFAAAFARVDVAPTAPDETLRVLLSEARALEASQQVSVDPLALREVLELGAAVFPSAALPGRAVELLRELVRASGPRAQLHAEDVLRLISRRTGLPRVMLDSGQALDPEALRATFARQVSGQPVAVDAVVDLLVRLKAGLVDGDRPFAVYLFTGPTGTGKTELASCLASYLYASSSRLVRLDMGEYSGGDAVPRLIGDRWNPVGVLTRQIQAQPFSVVLLDEIEKAHPSVLNLLLQVFDEGRLTDAAGTPADFRRTVIVMTSNLGARARATIGFGEDAASAARDVARAVREHFPPELFNRIDRVVPFAPLGPDTARAIAVKELAQLVTRRGLTERRIFVDVADPVVDVVVREAFDPRDGARPVKRWVEREVGGVLTERIVRDTGAALRRYTVFHGARGIDVHGERAEEAAPRPGRSALAADAPKPTPAALLERLERQLEWLVTEDEHEHWARLGGEPRDDAGAMREALDELRDRYRALVTELATITERLAPAARWSEDDIPTSSGRDRPAAAALRVHAAEAKPHAGAEVLTAHVAELLRQSRCLPDRQDHAALVLVSRIGRAEWRGRPDPAAPSPVSLVLALSQAIQAAVDGALYQTEDGTLLELAPFDDAELARVALPLARVGSRSLFRALSGVYVLESLAHGTTLARLDVYGPEQDARARLAQRRRAVLDHRAALANGTPGIPDPDALDRIVARLRITQHTEDEPVVELEDYLTSTVSTGRLPEVLRELLRRHACWEDPS
jgi:ATP-dependent Clp protease ATP-binding subunit ClpA/ATP-dependent Clp protease ATP-binding subunit ClpC